MNRWIALGAISLLAATNAVTAIALAASVEKAAALHDRNASLIAELEQVKALVVEHAAADERRAAEVARRTAETSAALTQIEAEYEKLAAENRMLAGRSAQGQK